MVVIVLPGCNPISWNERRPLSRFHHMFAFRNLSIIPTLGPSFSDEIPPSDLEPQLCRLRTSQMTKPSAANPIRPMIIPTIANARPDVAHTLGKFGIGIGNGWFAEFAFYDTGQYKKEKKLVRRPNGTFHTWLISPG